MLHTRPSPQWWRALHPRRITIAVVPGIVTALIVAAAVSALDRLDASKWWVSHTHDVLYATMRLQTRLLDAESAVRGYLVMGDQQTLGPYRDAEEDVHVQLAKLRALTGDNPAQRERLRALDTLLRARFAIFRELIAAGPATARTASPDVRQQRRALIYALRMTLGDVESAERALLAARTARDERNRFVAELVITVGGILAVFVALLGNALLARNVALVSQSNAELEAQARQLEEQARELEEQAAELEEQTAEVEASNAELEDQRDRALHARAEAEQANAAKSRFLSVMSHELRTPLNAIVGYVDIMDAGVHGTVTVDQREDIRRIKRAAGQLTSIINDILNFAKLEAGEVRFDIGPVPMHDALANAAALMEPQAALRQVRFAYVPCDPGLVAFADRERVQQVVLNLLSNAIKYTGPGGEVRLTCACDGASVCVRVSDTGRGIAPTDAHRIFEPFVQLLGALHAPSEGVGLGLAISRDLARGMGGDITVRSAVGEGSVFELTIPVMAPDSTDGAPPGRVERPARLGYPGPGYPGHPATSGH